MVRFDGLGCADSEPGKLIYLLGEPWHVPLQKLSLGDFEAAGGDDQSSGTRGQLWAGRVFQ